VHRSTAQVWQSGFLGNWRQTYSNNNRLTAFVRDYPGRPVPEEKFFWIFYGAGEDNGGRGTDSPGGCHPNRTNSTPIPTTPKVRLDALSATQPTVSKH